MQRIMYVGIGGFIGAALRYGISGWAQKQFGSAFPWGTFIVNAVGCLFIGYIMTYSVEIGLISTELRLFLVTGILGGLTTFSTLSYESVALLHGGSVWLGVWNLAVNMIVGLAAVMAGIAAARIM